MSRPLLGRPRIAAVALVVIAAVSALLWVAAPAQAHDRLIDSAPADGETLQVPPEEVVLRFSDDLLELGGAILVTDAEGRSWTEGDVVYDGAQARMALREGMPGGSYETRWRVVSGDGHPISGTIAFAVGDGADGPSPTASPPEPRSAASDGQDTASTGGPGGPGAVRIVVVGLGGGAVGVGGYWLATRLVRRRGARHGTQEADSSLPHQTSEPRKDTR